MSAAVSLYFLSNERMSEGSSCSQEGGGCGRRVAARSAAGGDADASAGVRHARALAAARPEHPAAAGCALAAAAADVLPTGERGRARCCCSRNSRADAGAAAAENRAPIERRTPEILQRYGIVLLFKNTSCIQLFFISFLICLEISFREF